MQSSALVFFFHFSHLGEWVAFSLEVARTESVALQIKRITLNPLLFCSLSRELDGCMSMPPFAGCVLCTV